MAEKRTTYKLQDVGGIGEVKIADEVVCLLYTSPSPRD